MAIARLPNLLLVLALACTCPTFARDGSLLPTDNEVGGLEPALLKDMADGRLDKHTLLEAALIAGGIDTAPDLRRYQERFAPFCDRVAKACPPEQQPREFAAKSLLAWLHEHVLTGDYQPSCTEVHRTLETGHYNCITATILYRCLADYWDLPLETVAEPGHVYCRLQGAKSVAIQTTSSLGLVRAGQTTEIAGQDAGSIPPVNPVRSLADTQLVAKIYYNRGVTLLKEGLFSAALSQLQRAEQLDPQDRVARQNILAGLNNWALEECQAGHFVEAVSLLTQARQIDPGFPSLDDNEVYVHYRWTRQLCDEGKYAQASEILQAAYRRRPDVPLYAQGRDTVQREWEAALRNARNSDQTFAVERIP